MGTESLRTFLGNQCFLSTEASLAFLFEVENISSSDIFPQVREVLSSPELFAKSLTKPLETLEPVERILLGISRTIILLRELFDLLHDTQEINPLLADSIRSYFRYWTDNLSSVTGMRVKSSLLAAFENWALEAKDEEALKQVKTLHKMVYEFERQVELQPA